MLISHTKLSDGHTIPKLGLGLWKVKDEPQFNVMFDAAIQAGYRHFDDAEAYGNEQFLGASWKRSGLKREEIFITTKSLWQHFSAKSTLDGFDESLRKLQTDYVDLLLVHFPGPTWLRKSKWRAIEAIKASGRAKSIGVSNHSVERLKELEAFAKEKPVVNQIEMHVFLQQPATRAYCKEHGIQIEAYSPLAHGWVMNNPLVQQIAQKHHRSYSQIMLRWCIEEGAIPLPKSTTPSRILENSQIFDFHLDADDLQRLKTLNSNHKTLWRSMLLG